MTIVKWCGVALIAAVALVPGYVITAGQGQEGPKKILSPEDEIRELKRRADKLETEGKEQLKTNKALEDALAVAHKEREAEVEARKVGDKQGELALTSLGVINPPVGSVVAYAGDWPPAPAPGTKALARKEWEEKIGWALCDGSLFDPATYPALHATLGGTRLPDYQGLFLRGLDPGGTIDRDRAAKDRVVGSYQADDVIKKEQAVSVTLPKTSIEVDAFVTLVQGGTWGDGDGDPHFAANHKHTPKATIPQMTLTGAATALGGGSDTRPKNRAVHFLIKIR
jgi:rhizosphere induced protein